MPHHNLLFLSLFLAIICFFGSLGSTYFFRNVATNLKILDDPKQEPSRKKHPKPIPLLGGTGFTLTATLIMLIVWILVELKVPFFLEIGQNLEPFNLFAICLAIFVLLLNGFLDDKNNSPRSLVFLLVFVALSVTIFLGGVRIESLSYPFDQIIPNNSNLHVILTYIWLGACVVATKFLDGHDGLVSLIGIINLFAIASISLLIQFSQPLIFVFAVVWAFGIAGFLPFNFPEAKLYLGEGGSEIIGFIIGVLSIISGAKIATTSTIIGWFILDFLLVIGLRFWKKKPILKGDRLHWHFRLQDYGFDKVKTLAITCTLILLTAHLGILLPTELKIFAILAQIISLSGIFIFTFLKNPKHSQQKC